MSRVLLVGLALTALLAACEAPSGTSDAGGTEDAAGGASCGTMTCGPSEYCVITCTCCGAPGGGTPSSTSECRTFSRSCDASNMCACAEVSTLGGVCDQDRRLVEIPCA